MLESVPHPFYQTDQLSGLYGLPGPMVLLQGTPFFTALLSGFFVLSFLINALLAWSMSCGWQSSLNKFIVAPYFFNFLIMDLMVRVYECTYISHNIMTRLILRQSYFFFAKTVPMKSTLDLRRYAV